MAYTTIDKPTDYFSVNLWVGNDASPRSFTGFGHQPDFVWVRYRDGGSLNHALVDVIRGGDKILFCNSSAAQDTKSHGEITSFDSDGITVADGTNASFPRLYFNDDQPFSGSGNYVGWSWKAGGSPSSNTDGSITSSVSANTTAGFSIVSYTATNANATVGHGLGVKPDLIFIKQASATGQGWATFHKDIVNTKFVRLNEADGANTSTDGTGNFNSTDPTTSVFSIGTAIATGGSTASMIAYCFNEVKGFSKFGQYRGTGGSSGDGAFVHLGFQPALVIIKRTDSGGNWHMYDNKRDPDNVVETAQQTNTTDGEFTTNNKLDFLSNGFRLRGGSETTTNADGGTYIYLSFAESSFVSSSGVPNTAR